MFGKRLSPLCYASIMVQNGALRANCPLSFDCLKPLFVIVHDSGHDSVPVLVFMHWPFCLQQRLNSLKDSQSLHLKSGPKSYHDSFLENKQGRRYRGAGGA